MTAFIERLMCAEKGTCLPSAAFAVLQDAIVLTDGEQCIVDVNPAFARITGYERDEVIGKTPALLRSGRHRASFFAAIDAALAADGAWRGEIWKRRKSGEVFPAMLAINALTDATGAVRHYVGVFSDISAVKQHETQLDLVAHYDALTGLPNRRLLADCMRQALSRARRSGKQLAICFIDLEEFKAVNDEYGHEAGDALLIEVALRLKRTLRAEDTLTRLGGDEFVLLYGDIEDEAACFLALERVLEALSGLTELQGRAVTVSASIGVTLYPRDDEDAEALLRHVDQGMYRAKQSGKNHYHLYDPVLDRQVSTQHEERQRIAEALEWGEFVLYFQPKIDLSSREVIGAEALIRWQHPARGLLPPAEFLPILANTRLEIALPEWVSRCGKSARKPRNNSS